MSLKNDLMGKQLMHSFPEILIEFSGGATLKFGRGYEFNPNDPPAEITYFQAMTPNSERPVGETYFNQKLCLYDRGRYQSPPKLCSDFDKVFATISATDGTGIMVEAGTHKYPFSIMVPWQIPSSISGEYGSVIYVAMATLERPWQPKVTVTKEFCTRSVLDLNTLPQHVLVSVCL